MRRALWWLLLALVAVPSCQAALTKSLPYEADFGFLQVLGTSSGLTLASGKLDAEAPSVRGSIGLFDVDTFSLRGLTRACWTENSTPQCVTGSLSIDVSQGGAVGLCVPSPVASRLHGDHALTLFVDLASDDDLNTLPVNRSLVAPLVGGTLQLSGMLPIADSGLDTPAAPCRQTGAIAALDDVTKLTLRNGGVAAREFTGKQDVLLFTGTPQLSRLGLGFVVLPFAAGSTAALTPATRQAADLGLDAQRIDDFVSALDQSHTTQTTRDEDVGGTLDDLPAAVKGLLNGAVLGIPAMAEGQELDPKDLTFVRFHHLDVAAVGNGLQWDGSAYLAAEEGRIDHAHSLAGVGFLSLPWWSWLLWVLAIGLFVTRLVLKPEKHSHWDRFRWIGWVATPVAILLVFLLVDLEARTLFGSSFLVGSEGRSRGIFFLIDIAFLGILGLVAGGPLRVLLRNGFLLLHQGTFMGLAGSIATLLSFLLGFSYLRDYLDLAFDQVVSKLG